MFFFLYYGDYAHSSRGYTYESKITSVMMPRKILEWITQAFKTAQMIIKFT